MKTALAWLQLIPALIAAIVSIIPALNNLLPQKGQGATKLALAKLVLEKAGDAVMTFWPIIEELIAAFCSAKKDAEPATADAVTPPVDPTVIVP